jgi:hypothetical protein
MRILKSILFGMSSAAIAVMLLLSVEYASGHKIVFLEVIGKFVSITLAVGLVAYFKYNKKSGA